MPEKIVQAALFISPFNIGILAKTVYLNGTLLLSPPTTHLRIWSIVKPKPIRIAIISLKQMQMHLYHFFLCIGTNSPIIRIPVLIVAIVRRQNLRLLNLNLQEYIKNNPAFAISLVYFECYRNIESQNLLLLNCLILFNAENKTPNYTFLNVGNKWS